MTVTLAEIEREVARRVGPFRQLVAASGDVDEVILTGLISTVENTEWQDLYLLRRGVKVDGSAVAGFDDDDRVRLIKLQTALTGALTPDRNWATAPIADEVVELHHLDPEHELRPAVLSGLRRCFFLDRAELTLTAAAVERNLTTLAAWIAPGTPVYAVEYQSTGSLYPPVPVKAWEVLIKADGLYLQTRYDPYPDTLFVTARRSHFTYVNADADDSTMATGPTEDDDELEVDLPYAVAAGHIEAWRLYRGRLIAAAREGTQATQQEAAEDFTRQARDHFIPPRPRIGATRAVRAGYLGEEAEV